MPARAIFGLLCLVVGLVPGAPSSAQERPYPLLVPGLQYVSERIGDVPWAIHVLKIDRTRTDLRLTTSLALGTVCGLSTVTRQVAGLPPGAGTPVAAANADFFVIAPGPYQGDPRGLHILSGELVSIAAEPRESFWIDGGGRPRIGTVRSRLRVVWPGGEETPVGLNEERKEDGAVLYTPRVGPATRTVGGRELVLARDGDGPWLPLRVGQVARARVREARDGGDTPLSGDTMVLSLGPGLLPHVPALAPSATLRIVAETDPALGGVETAIGGGPLLLRKGQPPAWGDGPQPRHPRTAIGWNERYLFLIVVDGRQPDLSQGMTIPELSELAVRLGCTEALNLDGGGSSTLWVGGKVVNVPSDGRERPVANALVIVRTPGAPGGR